MAKKYKVMLIAITIVLIGSIFLGTSYSLWQTSKTQVGVNEISVGCFNITYTNLDSYGGNEAGDINLVNAYPISDEAGSALTPYVFKIKNTCTIAANYAINLETLNTSNFNTDYLKVKFNEASNNSSTPTLYKDITATDVLLSNSTSAKQLTTGYLAANEEITYALRAWIDINATTTTPNVMGKTWNGKVVVSSEATKAFQESTVTGERVAYITNGADSRVKNLEITGGTENSTNVGQDGTMDIVVSGKNLFNYKKLNFLQSTNGITFSNNNDGSFTISGSKTDISQTWGGDYHLKKAENLSLFGLEGYYHISKYDCVSNTLLMDSRPTFYVNTKYNGQTVYSIISNDGTIKKNFTNEIINSADYDNYLGFWSVANKDITPGTYCPQIEYNDHATEFEPYKERRYTIELKDTNNNTINGLSSTDTLKKYNGVWVIDNGTTQTQLADATQNVLNTISTYSGISRIWVDDEVLITGINATYTKSNS